MNEVSASIFHYYRESAQRHGLPFEAATTEIPVCAELLGNRRRWYDWEDHRRFLLRLESLWGREKLEWLASQVRHRLAGRSLVGLARGFTRPYLLYWAGIKLSAPLLYRHIRFSIEELARERLQVVIEIPEPYGESYVFFYSWAASLKYTPGLIGLPDALVSAKLGGRRGVFEVRLPQSQTWWSHAGRRVSAILGSRALMLSLERDRQNLQEALEHQLKVERELIEALPDLVLRFEADGTLIEVMGDAAHALAEPLRALRGQRLSQLASFPAADATLRLLHADIAAAVAERRPKQRSVVLNAGLSQAFFDWRFVPNGEQVLAVVRDVSVERRLEGRLLTADRMASVGLLAASITHEINNPLTYVLGNLEILEKSLAAAAHSEPRRAAELRQVSAAKEGSTRIKEIVRGLRSFSRPTLEQAGPVDVNAVLDAMVQLAANVLSQRARVIKLYGAVPPVHAVEGRLGQVFVNLLVNAAQALPERVGELGEIRIRTFCAPAGRVTIEIQDDGLGIAPEQLPHIFEPFFTTKAAGTGLGLFIAQRIVLDLDGELEVESSPGEGTTLRVTLPIAEQAHETKAASSGPAPIGAPRRNVLVIDDQEPIAQAIKLLLSEHEVTLSARGDQALRLLTERDFDVVFCDVMMPEMSGPELYRQVAAARPGYERRFVFMTGGAFTQTMQAFLATTAQPCIEKPFAYEQIQEAIRSLAAGAG